MKVLRPPAEVARYTMVFHNRDSGNPVNGHRSVYVEIRKMSLTKILVSVFETLVVLPLTCSNCLGQFANCIMFIDANLLAEQMISVWG